MEYRTSTGDVSHYSVLNSQSSLIHSVQPSDCIDNGYVLGGVTMKLMDEVAGIVAFQHCRTNVVTASIGNTYINIATMLSIKNTVAVNRDQL